MKKGKLIVFSGPSGVGKGTIRKKLNFKDYVFSISSTTRSKRDGEEDGVDYNFLTKEQFIEKIDKSEMLEYCVFVGNFYGTDEKVVNDLLEQGKNVMLEIECQGALQVLEKVNDVVSIFILPPSMEELENRLRKRATEDEQTLQRRIKKAQSELKYKDKYQYNVINDNLEHVIEEIDKILFSEMG